MHVRLIWKSQAKDAHKKSDINKLTCLKWGYWYWGKCFLEWQNWVEGFRTVYVLVIKGVRLSVYNKIPVSKYQYWNEAYSYFSHVIFEEYSTLAYVFISVTLWMNSNTKQCSFEDNIIPIEDRIDNTYLLVCQKNFFHKYEHVLERISLILISWVVGRLFAFCYSIQWVKVGVVRRSHSFQDKFANLTSLHGFVTVQNTKDRKEK
jgi:hypothetical protein